MANSSGEGDSNSNSCICNRIDNGSSSKSNNSREKNSCEINANIGVITIREKARDIEVSVIYNCSHMYCIIFTEQIG